jgi:hypothetical protein
MFGPPLQVRATISKDNVFSKPGAVPSSLSLGMMSQVPSPST